MARDRYYKTLGLRPGVTDKGELKRVYRKLAVQHHPDRGGSEEKFKQICEAYEILVGKRQPSRHELREEAAQQQQRQRSQRPPQKSPYRDRQPKPAPRRQPRRMEYSYDVHAKCQTCQGQGQFVEHCVLCDGTGNIVGLNESGAVCVVRCIKCRHGVRKALNCQDCGGTGKLYQGTKKGYYWT